MPPIAVNWPHLFGDDAPHETVRAAYGPAADWAVVGTTPRIAAELGRLTGLGALIDGNRAARAHAAAVRARAGSAWTDALETIAVLAHVGADQWEAYMLLAAVLAPDTDPVGVPVPVRLLWEAVHQIDTHAGCPPGDWTGLHTYGAPHITGLTEHPEPWDQTWGTRWGHTLDLITGWADLGMSRAEASDWSSRGYHPQDAACLIELGHGPDSTLLDDWEADNLHHLPDGPWGAACPNLTVVVDRLRKAGCPAPWRSAFRVGH